MESPGEPAIEVWLEQVVTWLVAVVEAAGVLVIIVGALIALTLFVLALPKRDPVAFVPIRLTLGRFLALGLEFQLASDVLRTAVGPSLAGLAQLAAVAAIRTALNFFLAREIRDEQQLLEELGREMPTLPKVGWWGGGH
ncbi:MAG: DUF1622 domain-containing protein [Candidatus Nanopelagicales bacterium]|jgi:uncharacterized membrane protein|nr:DUF1622 domain-containing protein [Candidatus Nanopelagicales bacterium]